MTTARHPHRVWHSPGHPDGMAASPSMKAVHWDGADPLASLMPGGSSCSCSPWSLAGQAHPPAFDTLHLPRQHQGFLEELEIEI